MKILTRGNVSLAVVVSAGLVLAGCSPTGMGRGAPQPQTNMPAPITPVQTGTVQATDLPPIGGQASASPSVSTGSALYDPSSQPGQATGMVSGGQTNVVPAISDVAGTGGTIGGRNLAGGLTMENMIGGWTITAGAEQCRLNLTYTAKGATGRYRASTPACSQPTLAEVTSWQLLGSQVQLYNEADELVGTLLRSGDRFVGTLAGGQSISMAG
ncbi:AprI/Inh family metalloprotease inhibitor [Pelagibacterium lentulum]|uniref:Alkaline proteinase inhibitor/ Outer membrane lipoprotein Omp19 domain-containing protein n=1 Tax=Pelagibacterium lentulum TaxID=2029865 RepID=A0A916R5B1_9HYPH|nr:AprI/Inh family metalloprotease inhibitor [Pelagibacterium lentulum]GGA35915.1 hypothetical protein GCM10011499_01570 [Pelagibacterium lentulum]